MLIQDMGERNNLNIYTKLVLESEITISEWNLLKRMQSLLNKMPLKVSISGDKLSTRMAIKPINYEAIKIVTAFEECIHEYEIVSLEMAREFRLAWKMEKNNENILLFLSIFSNSVMALDELPRTPASLEEMKQDIKTALPNPLLRGNDPKHGLFITGHFFVIQDVNNLPNIWKNFIVSPKLYWEGCPVYQTITFSRPLLDSRDKVDLLKNLLRCGTARDNNGTSYLWPDFEVWENLEIP